MKTNINSDATELQNDQTLYSTVPPQHPAHSADAGYQPTVAPSFQSAQPTVGNSCSQATSPLASSKSGSGKAPLAKRVAVGAGVGLVLGGVASATMAMQSITPPDDTEAAPEAETSTNSDLPALRVCDGDGDVEYCVRDDLSFSPAFAAARAEVGPGGVFQWRGQIYGTYTADEWNSMTPEQKQDYYDHFNWDRIDAPSDVVDQPQVEEPQVEEPQAEEPQAEEPQVEEPQAEEPVAIDDDINVQTNGDESHPFTMTEDSEVEVIGVVHDSDSGSNFAEISVDGQQAILVDVDGDMQFDYIQADFDGDGDISSNEYADFQGQGPSVDQLGGFSDGYEPTNDDPIDNSDQIYDDI